MRLAIMEDIGEWKKFEKDSDEAQKSIKKMRMLYGHLHMWNTKMMEVHDKEKEKVDKPMQYTDLNKK